MQCLALMALAESAAAFGPSSSFLPRHPLLSPAICSIRAQPPAKQGGARAAALRLGGLRLAVSSAPVTISGTNIEVLCPSLVCLHRPQGFVELKERQVNATAPKKKASWWPMY